jgi:vacuolar iron transporter family protein
LSGVVSQKEVTVGQKWSAFVRAALRDAVFGVQDGLISTLGALTGIAEGTGRSAHVVLAGVVVVAVESLSMAAGSYLSSKSQRQYLERLLREEKESIDRDPQGERREVREMYGRRGYSRREIDFIERRLFRNKALLLEDMAHKELGIAPAALEEPKANAAVMGAAYLAGGLVPLTPYFLLPLAPAMAVSLTVTFSVLFAVGGVKGRLVGKSWSPAARPWRDT